ncbi:MAG TPA: mechanosensitive ion channel family protein [Chthoniobacterales bacterium]|jgi:small-conductance mechanosensitive channel|nr:mechanosensitive ion channel family protein [Chthoniobacterales bacterium]
MPETEIADEISRKPEVREELQRTGEKEPGQKIKAAAADKFWFVTHGLLLLGCAVIYYLITSKLIPLPQAQVELSQRLLRGFALVVIVLTVARSVRVYAIGRIEDSATRFTLRRILLLASGLLIVVIGVSVVFVNWYPAVAALGVGSIIVGLAVQTPMKSFIAWIYILVRRPFRVGDRIQIGDATGDVIDVGYLDTTLWEFGGKYISGDHPSGRVIRFPNEKVLDEIVWNYSWPLFPYIWNEIKFQIAYQSDLKFVADTMQRIVAEELGQEMADRVEAYRQLLARTPVDELEVREHPRVIFRVDEVTWIDAIVRYVVSPRESGRVKSQLIPKLLAALNAAPQKVMFPKGDAR